MRHGLYSKARIAGHPIHPMLVHFPIALFLGGLLALFAHMGTGELFWYRVAYVAFLAGSVTAVAAAIAGAVDLFGGIPRGTTARATGIQHMALNVVALVLFAATGIMMYGSYDAHVADPLTVLDTTLPLVLSVAGSVVLGVSGALGSKLTYKHHVGQEIDDERTLDEQLSDEAVSADGDAVIAQHGRRPVHERRAHLS